ncbi:hypothetical protein [Bradyrhizobium sp. Ai1a-2]|uniref:hypothetical protein n=1 Tax=Bradyrhizobium sp. Ai1a-2 TaxID=196490 RepID=UPI000427DA07|nr:hypothetical protein [Bradyrhizobium sp. Ai1a-2]
MNAQIETAARILDRDRGSRAADNPVDDGSSERQALALFTTIERTLRNDFYSNRRRATFLFEFCAARILRERFVPVSSRQTIALHRKVRLNLAEQYFA